MLHFILNLLIDRILILFLSSERQSEVPDKRASESRWEHMTLKQLEYLIVVAETGSITEAARKLYIAQPSLTAAIHELEKEYDIPIFTRSRKGMELTPEGGRVSWICQTDPGTDQPGRGTVQKEECREAALLRFFTALLICRRGICPATEGVRRNTV